MFLIYSVYTPKPPLVHLNVCYQFAVQSVHQFILDSYVLRDSVNRRLDDSNIGGNMKTTKLECFITPAAHQYTITPAHLHDISTPAH